MRLVVLLACLAGCVRDDLTACSDGTACPAGTACDVVHGGCVQPEQLAACAQLAEGADCTAGGLVGGCFAGVCLERGCGNRVIESEEACDDGNRDSGDGCRSDCRSDESCGNGILDSGEQCDDGNLRSRDDCDSRCIRETTRLRTVVLSASLTRVVVPVYDPVHHQLVSIRGHTSSTWLFDGTRWTVTFTPTPPARTLVWDPDRERALAISMVDDVQAWDGTSWSAVTTSGPPELTVLAAVHDTPRHRTLAIVSPRTSITELWQLDAAGQWSSLGIFEAAPRLDGNVLAVDPQTGDVVIRYELASTGTLAVFDGTTWTRSPDSLGISRMFAYRGELRAITTDGQMFARRGRLWFAVPRENLGPGAWVAYHDVTTDTVVATDGSRTKVLEASAWVDKPILPGSSGPMLGAADTFHVFTGTADGVDRMRSWRIHPDVATYDLVQAPGAPLARFGSNFVASLGRGGGVLVGGQYVLSCPGTCSLVELNDTRVFDGVVWTEVENAIDVPANFAGTYDPAQRRVLVQAGPPQQLWQLRDEDTQWSPTGLGLDRQIMRMVWDAHQEQVVGTIGSTMLELRDGAWVEADLYPKTVLYLTKDERTGGVLVLTPEGSAGDRVLWERRAGLWTKVDYLPRELLVTSDAYMSREGALLFLGLLADASVAVVRDRTSPTPIESCEPGVDADGDGRAYCEDPDCYWRCSRCPPYVSCRFDYPAP